MMHTKAMRTLVVAALAPALLAGCANSIESAPASEALGDEIRSEWKRILAVEIENGRPVREQVGYLNRRYSEVRDPDGIFFILDNQRNRLGFVLPTGRAYMFRVRELELEEKKDLGNLGFENGIKAILGFTGSLEFEALPTERGA